MHALHFGIILSDRFSLSGLASFVDVLAAPVQRDDTPSPLCRWTIISARDEPVESNEAAVAVQPDERLGDPGRFTHIVVVGGTSDVGWASQQEVSRFLHLAARFGVSFVGIGSGAKLLHQAGLLPASRLRDTGAPTTRPGDDIVVDGDRLTGPVGVGAARLAAFIVERHYGRDCAIERLRILTL